MVEDGVERVGLDKSPGDGLRHAFAVTARLRWILIESFECVRDSVRRGKGCMRIDSGGQEPIRDPEEVAKVAGQRMAFKHGNHSVMQVGIKLREAYVGARSRDSFPVRRFPEPR